MRREPLSRAFNVAVKQVASQLFPCGYDVNENAPQSFGELVGHYHMTGRIKVWSGASDQTIFACPDTNYAFRAWHDWRHITENAPFTKEGEAKVCTQQCADLRNIYGPIRAGIFSKIIHAEIMGQFAYCERHGRFPHNQRLFVKDYLRAPCAALSVEY